MTTKVTSTSDCRKSPNSEYRFFLYDPEDMGLMFYKSAEVRDQVAAHNIAEYSTDGDGWSEEVGCVCAGEVTAQATKTDVVKRPERSEFACDSDYDDAMEEWPGGDFDETCNYELRPTPEAAAVLRKLENAREFVRLRWRHLVDCPEVGSHPNAVDLERCNCGLKIALADLGAAK